MAKQVPDLQADSPDGEWPVRTVGLDGKVLRGSYDRDLGADGKPRDEPAQQQLSTLDLGSGAVIGQRGFSGQKDAAEGATLRALVPQCEPGTCVIADALHTNRVTAQHLLDHDLEFVLTVKGQPAVLEQVRAGFHWDCMSAHTSEGCERGRIERRSIRVSAELEPPVPYISFPGVRCVAQVQREVEYKKDGRKRQPETVYLLTSLPPEVATPQLLLQLNRAYWGIEKPCALGARRGPARGRQPSAQGCAAARVGGRRQHGDVDPAAAEDRGHQAACEPVALEPALGRRTPARLKHPLLCHGLGARSAEMCLLARREVRCGLQRPQRTAAALSQGLPAWLIAALRGSPAPRTYPQDAVPTKH